MPNRIKNLIAASDPKTQEWIKISYKKGYEKAGVIFYIFDPRGLEYLYILGVKEGQSCKGYAEYPNGNVSSSDFTSNKETAARIVFEKTGLDISIKRFTHFFKITGGITETESYREFYCMRTQMDGLNYPYSKYILVRDLFSDTIKDLTRIYNKGLLRRVEDEFHVQEFIKIYIWPQIKIEFLHGIKINLRIYKKYSLWCLIIS